MRIQADGASGILVLHQEAQKAQRARRGSRPWHRELQPGRAPDRLQQLRKPSGGRRAPAGEKAEEEPEGFPTSPDWLPDEPAPEEPAEPKKEFKELESKEPKPVASDDLDWGEWKPKYDPYPDEVRERKGGHPCPRNLGHPCRVVGADDPNLRARLSLENIKFQGDPGAYGG